MIVTPLPGDYADPATGVDWPAYLAAMTAHLATDPVYPEDPDFAAETRRAMAAIDAEVRAGTVGPVHLNLTYRSADPALTHRQTLDHARNCVHAGEPVLLGVSTRLGENWAADPEGAPGVAVATTYRIPLAIVRRLLLVRPVPAGHIERLPKVPGVLTLV